MRGALLDLERQHPGGIPTKVRRAFTATWSPTSQQAGRLTPGATPIGPMADDALAARMPKPGPSRSLLSLAPTTSQLSPVDAAAATYESRIKDLQNMMTDQTDGFEAQQQQMQAELAAQQQQMQADLVAQQQNFAAQQQQMQKKLAAQQAAYEKQAQLTANAQRAYTPAPEATATETTTTDSGIGIRRNARSGLSSLAIIEGLGTNANPLSGLQLA